MIGVFDSGIGGLTVVKALRAVLPHHDILYFGDTARTPYGSKSPETVTAYALENTRFLRRQGASMVVMACNTASSVAFESVSAAVDFPVFEVVRPAVRRAAAASQKGRIGIIGTRATINSRIYEERICEIRPGADVYSVACPLLVPLVEEGWLQKPATRMIVKNYLHALKTRQIDTLILGCTHYPLLRESIQAKIGRRVTLVDSAETVAEVVHTAIHQPFPNLPDLSQSGTIRIFVSDLTDQFLKTARMILKQNIEIRKTG
jgi:glutamate racemase